MTAGQNGADGIGAGPAGQTESEILRLSRNLQEKVALYTSRRED
jgi:hypothetical protein